MDPAAPRSEIRGAAAAKNVKGLGTNPVEAVVTDFATGAYKATRTANESISSEGAGPCATSARRSIFINDF